MLALVVSSIEATIFSKIWWPRLPCATYIPVSGSSSNWIIRCFKERKKGESWEETIFDILRFPRSEWSVSLDWIDLLRIQTKWMMEKTDWHISVRFKNCESRRSHSLAEREMEHLRTVGHCFRSGFCAGVVEEKGISDMWPLFVFFCLFFRGDSG